MNAVSDERIREIARVAHAAMIELQAQHGDPDPSLPGDLGDAEAHAVTVAGIRAIIGGATPEQLHETWVRAREAQEWKFGPRKDSRLKTHPCMVAYGKLPEHQRVKDRVFAAIVLAMTGGAAPGMTVSPDLACTACDAAGMPVVPGSDVSVTITGAARDMVRVEASWAAGDRGEWLVRMEGDDFHDAAVLAGNPHWCWTGYLASGHYSLHVEGHEPASFEVPS